MSCEHLQLKPTPGDRYDWIQRASPKYLAWNLKKTYPWQNKKHAFLLVLWCCFVGSPFRWAKEHTLSQISNNVPLRHKTNQEGQGVNGHEWQRLWKTWRGPSLSLALRMGITFADICIVTWIRWQWGVRILIFWRSPPNSTFNAMAMRQKLLTANWAMISLRYHHGS